MLNKNVLLITMSFFGFLLIDNNHYLIKIAYSCYLTLILRILYLLKRLYEQYHSGLDDS